MVKLQWTLDTLAEMIVKMLLLKFDSFIVISGKRGLGKSTLGIQIARKVSRLMRRISNDETLPPDVRELAAKYKYSLRKNTLYKVDDVIKFFNGWNGIGVGDEMINVSFSRDFYKESSKDLIKIINMNRDHRNLFIACVPTFKSLDTQIRGLTKMHINIRERGFGVIMLPNKTMFSNDIWDMSLNEKIERKWIEKKSKKIPYTRLTTYRGWIKFPPLKEKYEEKYIQIKTEQRNVIAKEEMEIDKEENDPVTNAVKMLLNNQVRNVQVLDGMALALGQKPESFLEKIRRKLKNEGKNHHLGTYYWDKKRKKVEKEEEGWREIV